MSLTYCNTLIKTCRVDWVRKFVSNACVACKCAGSLQKSARRVASIYSHTPVRSAEIWILFSPENIFIIKLGWLINFSHYISVFVLVFPLSFYYSITLEMGKINNWRTYWKISRGKRGKWHFRDPKLNISWEKHASQKPATVDVFPVVEEKRPPEIRLRFAG